MNKNYRYGDHPQPAPPPRPRLTQEQFEAQQAELLDFIPQEFHAAIRYNAWEHGHSSGYEEVLLYVSDLVDAFAQPIKDYTKRIKG